MGYYLMIVWIAFLSIFSLPAPGHETEMGTIWVRRLLVGTVLVMLWSIADAPK